MNLSRKLAGYEYLTFRPWARDLVTAIYSVYEKGSEDESLQIRKLGERREIIIRDPRWKIIYDVPKQDGEAKA